MNKAEQKRLFFKSMRKRDRKKDRIDGYLCVVCGQFYSHKEYYIISEFQSDRLFRETPPPLSFDEYMFETLDIPFYEYGSSHCHCYGCSKECDDKIKYALDINKSGITGICKRNFQDIIGCPSVSEPERWSDLHAKYEKALLAKQYLTLRQEIKVLNKKKENENGTSGTRN